MGDGTLNPFLLHAFLLALETSRSAVTLHPLFACLNAFILASKVLGPGQSSSAQAQP